jgi:HPt (histidine-containing phosphotransfer) domain-containing protein
MEDSKDLMVSEALERLDGDKEFFAEIVGEFLSDYPRSLAEIEAAAVSGNYESLNHAAHSMKSALANLGAMSASGFCFELEKIGRFKQEITRAPALVGELRSAVARFESLFKQLMAE